MKEQSLIEKGMKLTLEEMRLNIPENARKPFYVGFERRQLAVELYIPKKEDFQTPHDRDECYIITRGEGNL